MTVWLIFRQAEKSHENHWDCGLNYFILSFASIEECIIVLSFKFILAADTAVIIQITKPKNSETHDHY